MCRGSQYPTGWKETTLGDLAHYINGYAFRPEDWKKVGLPIIRIQQINDPEAEYDCFDGPIADQYRIDNGDLLFSWSATLTTLIWNRGPAVLNQHIFKVIPREGADLHFLHHLLEYLMDDLAGQTHGSTMRHIKRSDLLPLPVVVPPPEEQRCIAEILDAADEAIQQTQRVIAKLKAVKAGLLHDLLTRGLDEHGRLRDPQAHPEQFKDSPLGRIPREWEVVTVESIAANKRHAIVDGPFGSNLKSEHYRGQGVPVIQSGYVTSGEFWAESYVYVDHSLFQAQIRSAVEPGDIVMAKIGAQCGTCALLPEEHPVSILASNSLKISTDYQACRPHYLLRVLHYFFDTGRMELVKTETAQPAISLKNLRALMIPLTGLAEQDVIVAALDAHDARIRAEEVELAKLRQVKRGLMDDLLTGRVRVV